MKFTKNQCQTCQIYDFKNFINDPTCLKNPENPSCIDIIMTNKLVSIIENSQLKLDFQALIK